MFKFKKKDDPFGWAVEVVTLELAALREEEENDLQVKDIIRTQDILFSNVAYKDEKNKIIPINFPKIKIMKNNWPENFHLICIDMRTFNSGSVDFLDYHMILNDNKKYKSYALKEKEKIFFINKKGALSEIKGIFDADHPDPRSKYMRERIHGIGFINEKKFAPGEIGKATIIYHNPEFFSDPTFLRKAWPMQ